MSDNPSQFQEETPADGNTQAQISGSDTPQPSPNLENIDFSAEWSVILNDPETFWTVAGGK